VVYGVMRTEDAVSVHGAAPVALSLGLFVVVYFCVFGVGISYMLRLISKGPLMSEDSGPALPDPDAEKALRRPLFKATDEEYRN
jgi:cytochrome d ubiquinol oxidase subunit I